MKEFFTDIFEYHHHYNQLLIHQMMEIEHLIPERSIPNLSHILNAHQIWNSRILKKGPLKVHQLHFLPECKILDDDNFAKTLEILQSRDLSEIITYTNSTGSDFTNSIQEILFHVSTHFSHHRGQIISDIRQVGIDPVMTDYIFYKR